MRHRTDESDKGADTASTSDRTEKAYSASDSEQPSDVGPDDGGTAQEERVSVAPTPNLEQACWTKTTNQEEKSREEEFDEYLADLLL